MEYEENVIFQQIPDSSSKTEENDGPHQIDSSICAIVSINDEENK